MANETNDFMEFLGRTGATHGLEQSCGYVLKRNVEILADAVIGSHDLQESAVNPLGIAIQNSNPREGINFCQIFQKVGKTGLSAQIYAISSTILRHQIELYHPLRSKPFSLFQQVVPRPTAVRTSDGRDGTKSTAVTATFRNFQVSTVKRSRKNSSSFRSHQESGGLYTESFRIPLLKVG